MRRSKVMLTYIENAANRKACFKKRKAGLIKKVHEISVLCGVEACLIVHCPIDRNLVVWPSLGAAQRLLRKFHNLPEMERRKRMLTQEAFMRQQVRKLEARLIKIRRRNNKADMDILMHQIYEEGKPLSQFDVSELMRLTLYVEEKIKDARRRIEYLERLAAPNNLPLPSVPAPAAVAEGPFSTPEDGALNNVINGWVNMDDGQSKQLSLQQLYLPHCLTEHHQSNGGNGTSTRGEMVKLLPQLPYHDGIDVAMPQDNHFGGTNGGADLGLFYGSSSKAIGGNEIGRPYGNFGGTIGGTDTILPYSLGGGTNIGVGLPYGNHGQPILNIPQDNLGLGPPPKNFAGNNGGFNFLGNSIGINMGVAPAGPPTQGNFATSGEGIDFAMFASFLGGNSTGIDQGLTGYDAAKTWPNIFSP